MDAVKFLKDCNRICATVDCLDCPLHDEHICMHGIEDDEAEEAVSIVEQWSKEHPIVTNLIKFQEVFGVGGLPKAEAPPSWWDEEYKELKGEQNEN